MRKVSKPRARLLACALMVAAAPYVAAGQARERVVEYDWKTPERPAALINEAPGAGAEASETRFAAVEVVEVSAAGRAVEVGGPFEAGDDWVGGLKVRLRNVSGKGIAGAALYLSLPEAVHGGGALQLSLTREKGAGAVAPWEEFDLTLPAAEHERQRGRVARLTGVTSVGRVGLGFIVVTFEDGGEWSCQMAGVN